MLWYIDGAFSLIISYQVSGQVGFAVLDAMVEM
jgi:hypothetical protein